MILKDLIKNYSDFLYDKKLKYFEIKKITLVNNLKDFKSIEDFKHHLIIFTNDSLKDKKVLASLNSLDHESIACLQNKELFQALSFKNTILIPEDENLINLVICFLDKIRESQYRLIRENNYINSAFMEMNIKQASIEEYIQFLGSIIETDIIYHGKLDYVTYYNANLFLEKSLVEDLSSLDFESYYIQKIQQNNQLYGYIIINELPSNIAEKDRLIIKYTSSMILLRIQNQIAIDNSKELVRSDLIADLCMNNIKSKEEVIFRANIQGWELRSSGLLAVIFDIDEFKHTMLHSNKDYDELEEEKQLIYNLVIKEMEKIPYDSYYYSKSDSIIFLVNVDFENNLADLDNFILHNINPIHNLQKAQDLNFTLTIGVGTYYEDIMQTYKSYNEAIEAINISRVFKEVDDICCYKDVTIFKDLTELMSRKDYNSIYINLVENIINLDRENKTEYFKTLKAIIKNDWNLKDSSEDLFIHYNTVHYRFEKIKRLLGMDFNNFYEKLIITLTVMVLEVDKHIDFNKGMFKK